MVWFKVDDTLAMHPKPRVAGLPAMGLWLLAGSWSAQQGTDGAVPTHMLPAFGATKKHAQQLVQAGMWITTDTGYRFHDWLEYQPTAAEVLAEKRAKSEKKAEAGRLGGLASGVARRRNGSTGQAEEKAEDTANAKQQGKQEGKQT